ncbi:hypothetical protein CCC_00322 [Paramagnetospirillum magnetotacticum MS-1]|uniref:Uncharacterized protein n=1 Tax=Paramagnetospirillum magnetotacticum MS-1 TaxID=272627 RepID=A0A0C2UWR7_PARME|nr:hypothetical protein [Paramagnetospirillum magnetotacticum]KIL97261.1 hypothetical protein CCC_00322 [Paramagnetospirillum magnetotacticum MS-1]
MARFRHLLTAFALALLLAPALARAEAFLSAYEDLPLPPGLTEAVGSGMSFDSPSGRIVEAYAHGAAKPADILKFYAATLPQLGWARANDRLYRREAEVLRLETTQDRAGVTLRVTISPE